MVGTIVAAGTSKPQWLFVTRVEDGEFFGRTWSAARQCWTKRASGVPYAREAIGVRTPRCPKPQRPQD
jgi:hypothetical protein